MFKNQPKNLVEQPQNSDILKFHKMDDKNFGDALDQWISNGLIYALKCMTNKNQPKIQVEQPQNSVILSIILKILNNYIRLHKVPITRWGRPLKTWRIT